MSNSPSSVTSSSSTERKRKTARSPLPSEDEIPESTRVCVSRPVEVALAPRPSALDKSEWLECVDTDAMRALLLSPYLRPNWDLGPVVDECDLDAHDKMKRGTFSGERDQLMKMLDLLDPTTGCLAVTLRKSSRNPIGRVFPENSLSVSCLRKPLRNFVIRETSVDCDAENCHPVIICTVGEQAGVECGAVRQYVRQREDVLREVMTMYGVGRGSAKGLFLRLGFLGSFAGWCRQEKLHPDTPASPFIQLFHTQVCAICEAVMKRCPQMQTSARKWVAANLAKESEAVQKRKIRSRFFGLYCQETELRIVEAVVLELARTTSLFTHPLAPSKFCGMYQWDGVQFRKEAVANFPGGAPAICALMKDITLRETGFALEWVVKEFDPNPEGQDLTPYIEQFRSLPVTPKSLLDELKSLFEQLDNDCSIVTLVDTLWKGHFVYSGVDKEWRCWHEEQQEWKVGKEYLVQTLSLRLPAYLREQVERVETQLGDTSRGTESWETFTVCAKKIRMVCSDLGNWRFQSGILCEAACHLRNDDAPFDQNGYLLGFTNGVFDIAAWCFRNYRFDDYVTFRTGWSFTPEWIPNLLVQDGREEVLLEGVDHIAEGEARKAYDTLQAMFQKIFPDPLERDCAFTILASGLVGRHFEKFFVLNGAGRNGKGFQNKLMEHILGPDHFYHLKVTALTDAGGNRDPNAPDPVRAGLHLKRYVVSSEPEARVRLNVTTIRLLTGGDQIKARHLHCNGRHIENWSTLVFECNTKPLLTSDPMDADFERYVDVPYVARFTDKTEDVNPDKHIHLGDPAVKEVAWLRTHRNAMTNLLFRHLYLLRNRDYCIREFIPASIQARTLAYLGSCFVVRRILEEGLKPGKPDAPPLTFTDISNALLHDQFRPYALLPLAEKAALSRAVLAKHLKENDPYSSNVRRNGVKNQLCLHGFVFRGSDEDDDEGEDEGEELGEHPAFPPTPCV